MSVAEIPQATAEDPQDHIDRLMFELTSMRVLAEREKEILTILSETISLDALRKSCTASRDPLTNKRVTVDNPW